MTSPISVAGLILDIAGASVLVLGILVRRPSSWYAETMRSGYDGGNKELYVGVARQSADALVGLSLLVLGFGGQLASSAGADPAWASMGVLVPIAIGVALLGVAILPLVRWKWIRNAIAYDLSFRTVDNAWKAIELWGFTLHMQRGTRQLFKGREHERRSGELVTEYGPRLLAKWRWRKLVKKWGGLPNILPAPQPPLR